MRNDFRNENSRDFWYAFSGKISTDKEFYGNPNMARNLLKEEFTLAKEEARTL